MNEQLVLLSSLGFEGARARAALDACDGDVERAANLLFCKVVVGMMMMTQ